MFPVVLPVESPMTLSFFQSICPMIRHAAVSSNNCSLLVIVIFISVLLRFGRKVVMIFLDGVDYQTKKV